MKKGYNPISVRNEKIIRFRGVHGEDNKTTKPKEYVGTSDNLHSYRIRELAARDGLVRLDDSYNHSIISGGRMTNGRFVASGGEIYADGLRPFITKPIRDYDPPLIDDTETPVIDIPGDPPTPPSPSIYVEWFEKIDFLSSELSTTMFRLSDNMVGVANTDDAYCVVWKMLEEPDEEGYYSEYIDDMYDDIFGKKYHKFHYHNGIIVLFSDSFDNPDTPSIMTFRHVEGEGVVSGYLEALYTYEIIDSNGWLAPMTSVTCVGDIIICTYINSITGDYANAATSIFKLGPDGYIGRAATVGEDRENLHSGNPILCGDILYMPGWTHPTAPSAPWPFNQKTETYLMGTDGQLVFISEAVPEGESGRVSANSLISVGEYAFYHHDIKNKIVVYKKNESGNGIIEVTMDSDGLPFDPTGFLSGVQYWEMTTVVSPVVGRNGNYICFYNIELGVFYYTLLTNDGLSVVYAIPCPGADKEIWWEWQPSCVLGDNVVINGVFDENVLVRRLEERIDIEI